MRLPTPYAAWLSEAGPGGLRHALAAAVGDADRRWAHTGLPLFAPGVRPGPALPPLPEPERLLLAAHPHRRQLGAYYTPEGVGDWLAAQVCRDTPGHVYDPACGAGNLLLAALRAGVPWTALWGTDLDPLAVMLAQARLAVAAGLDRAACARLRGQVFEADALTTPWPRAPVVLTNPPFLNRLRNLTATSPGLAAGIRDRHGSMLGPYADISAVFLAECLRQATTTGIVLPASILATRDTAGLRARYPAPTAAWTLPPRCFEGVGVPLVAAVFDGRAVPCRRFVGQPPRPLGEVHAERWSAVLCGDDPPPPVAALPGRAVGDLAVVEADFRDEYYALRGHVTEAAAPVGANVAPAAPEAHVRVVTSGLLDPGRLAWGRRPARIHGTAWTRPVVARDHLHPRQARRTGPQVLVATQTRVLEAAPDPRGDCVGLTPVLVALPRAGVELAALLATLLSPAATAWALREGRGTGLSLDTIKLSAAQLRAMPAWPVPAEALTLARRLVEGRGDRRTVWALGRAMAAGDDALYRWWRGRFAAD